MKKKIKIVSRVEKENQQNQEIEIVTNNIESIAKEKYLKLKEKLFLLTKEDITNKLETAKILKEINENKYYIFEGYKTFTEFLIQVNISKNIAYRYIKLITGVDMGVIDYNYIDKFGIENSLKVLEDKAVIKKSNTNPIKPLRFQLQSQTAYNFYKENSKFTSFLMDKMFSNYSEILTKELEEFKKEK